MAKLARVFAGLNKDYSDFLVLKGEVNVPMVRYPHIRTIVLQRFDGDVCV